MSFVATRPEVQEFVPRAFATGMRGAIDDLPTPRPLAELLPAVFQEDEFCVRLMAAFDELIAPTFCTLDCFDAYLDPVLAPSDFVDWIAGWVGVDIDETWTLERRRRLIQEAVGLYRNRGTIAGLSSHIELYCGITPEIDDNGGTGWSQTADTPIPGTSKPHVKVRIQAKKGSELRQTTVNRIVDASRPAHVPFEVEIVVGGSKVRQAAADQEDKPDEGTPGAIALPGSDRIELAVQMPDDEEELEAEEASDGDEASP